MVDNMSDSGDVSGNGGDRETTGNSEMLAPKPQPSPSYTNTVIVNEIPLSVFARGGFGEIGLGTLSSGQLVAVKYLYVRPGTEPDFRKTKVFQVHHHSMLDTVSIFLSSVSNENSRFGVACTTRMFYLS